MAARGTASGGRTASARALSAAVNGLSREQVAGVQRARMLSAIGEVVAERGLGSTTVAHVVARSGVSRRTFYEHFADREQCFLAALDTTGKQFAAQVVTAYKREDGWRERIRAGLAEALIFLEAEPHKARLLIVHTLGAGPVVLERRQRSLALLIAAVDEGRKESRPGSKPLPLAAEGVVGAALSVIHARLLQESHPPLARLTSELMGIIVLPYLGPAAARRELARPAPPAAVAVDAGLASLRDLDMRLTYRTMCVLNAIGSHPGASNRQVAQAAGIHDQGQVSKLLRRLELLGLIRNRASGRPKGEANAWTLTERGAAVQAAISAQTAPS